VVEHVSPALGIKPQAAKHFAKVICDLLAELVPQLFRLEGTDFITPADAPVDGTQYAVMRFRLDSELFDQKIRATSRARGFNVELGHSDLPVAGVATATVGAAARSGNGRAADAPDVGS
jgi:hypothetical protein